MAVLDSDAFGSLDTTRWDARNLASATGGRMRITCNSSFSGYAQDSPNFTIRDTATSIQMFAPGAVTGRFVWCELFIDEEHAYKFVIDSFGGTPGQLRFIEYNGGDDETSVAYNSTTHAWFRFLVEGTTIKWQTSSDGSTWTTRREKTGVLSVDSTYGIQVGCGYGGSAPSPAYMEVDNYLRESIAAKVSKGKAAGTGTGTGSAKGKRKRKGKGAGTGSGTAAVKGKRLRRGKAAATGSGTASAIAKRKRKGAAAGAGAGAGTAAGKVIGFDPNPPTGEVLDDFNRADESPLSQKGNWFAAGGTPQLVLVGNEAENPAAGFEFATSLYGLPLTDSEVFVTVNAFVGQLTTLYLRSDSSATAGYIAEIASGEVLLSVLGGGELDSGSSEAIDDGSTFCLKGEGTLISVWHRPPEGEWELLCAAVDSTRESGYIGLSTNSPNTRYDDFGGGGEPVPPPPPLPDAANGLLTHRVAIATTLTDPIERTDDYLICQWWETDRITAAQELGTTVLIYQNLTRAHEPDEEGRYSSGLTLAEAEALGAVSEEEDGDAGMICWPGTAGYAEAWLAAAVARAEEVGAEGVFCDDMNAWNEELHGGDNSMPEAEWNAQVQACNEVVGPGLSEAGLLSIANMAGTVGQAQIYSDGWLEEQFDFYDGGLDEFFVTWPEGTVQPRYMIEAALGVMYRQQLAGKLYLACSNSDDEAVLRFAMAACMVNTAGGVSFFAAPAGPDYGMQSWTEDFDTALALGLPKGQPKEVAGGFTRRFARGTVSMFWEDLIGLFAFAAPERIAVTREFPPDKLAVRITPPKGAPSRWAADEALAENVIDDLKYSGDLNGGEKEMAGGLARDPRTSFPDLAAFSDIEVYGPGVDTVWEGRLDKAPESDGDHMSIDPAAVGHRAALEDNKAMIGPGFIDGDLSKWGEPSLQRRKVLSDALIKMLGSPSVGQGSVEPGAFKPALVFDFNDVTTVATDTEAAELHYFSGGPDLGEIRYDALGDIAGGEASANWESNVAGGKTDTFAGGTVGTDHNTAAALNQSLAMPEPGYKYARIRNWLNAASEGTTLKRIFAWQPKVLGDHGLDLQGEWPDVGFTAKQMLAYAIPKYTYLEVDEDEMEDDGFVIPQAWFAEPGTMLQVVEELVKYGLLDWFVRGKKFHYRRPGTYGRRWQLYAGPSALKEQGLDASRLWRSIVVKYTDVDGSTRTVGPRDSGAMVEDAGLQIDDPDHPAVRAALTRQDVLDLGGIGTQAQAIATGERWLEEANLLSRSGSCTASYYAMDDRGIFRPVSQIKEGDLVRFPDSHDTSWRKVTSREYTHATRSNNLSLDAPREGLIALVNRYGAKLASLGLG